MRAASVVHLPCTAASVAVARRVLADELRAAGVLDGAVRDAALVVSELLSNAILHAYPLPGGGVEVAWDVDGACVEVAVSDGGGATTPMVGHPSEFSPGGRGLGIVAHLSLTWGVRANGAGLTVWAVLPAPRPGHAGGAGVRGEGEPVVPRNPARRTWAAASRPGSAG